jgi:hypothetical protein
VLERQHIIVDDHQHGRERRTSVGEHGAEWFPSRLEIEQVGSGLGLEAAVLERPGLA